MGYPICHKSDAYFHCKIFHCKWVFCFPFLKLLQWQSFGARMLPEVKLPEHIFLVQTQLSPKQWTDFEDLLVVFRYSYYLLSPYLLRKPTWSNSNFTEISCVSVLNCWSFIVVCLLYSKTNSLVLQINLKIIYLLVVFFVYSLIQVWSKWNFQ